VALSVRFVADELMAFMDLDMPSIRKLPIICFASCACFALNIDTSLLVGRSLPFVVSPAFAKSHTAPAEEKEGEPGAATLGEAVNLPADPEMIDDTPTMTDTAPTLAGAEPPSSESDGAEKEGVKSAGAETPDKETLTDKSAEIPPSPPCAVDASVEEKKPADGQEQADTEAITCLDLVDAAPVVQTNGGEIVPLKANGGLPTTEVLLNQRLAERREQLDKMGEALDTQAAILAAAEQRLDQRAAELATMQASIEGLIGQKVIDDKAQRDRMVSLYETMKPKEAAIILEGLDKNVLTTVARAMNPRKMAAILAKMSPQSAQALTVALATPEIELPDVAREGSLSSQLLAP